MVNRVGGLVSGMDIDSLVAKMMQAEKAPLNKLQQQKQTYEWQRDAYRDTNKSIKTLSDYMFDNMTKKASLIKKNVTSSSDAITATANAGVSGSIQIASVNQLATSATVKSQGTFGEGTSKETKLKDVMMKNGALVEGAQEIKMKVLKENGKMEDVTISLDENDTISTMVSKFNATDTGLNAYYDERSGSFSLSTKATGAGKVYIDSTSTSSTSSATVTGTHKTEVDTSMYVDVGNSFFEKLGLNSEGDLTDNSAANPNRNTVVDAGKNAKFVYNGLELERNSNTFDLNGLTVTLNKTYTEATPITLKATTDVDNFINQVEEFVNKYNDFVRSTQSKLSETKYRDYQPLTDEQRKDMSEDQVKKWEEKAMSGVLRRDQTISSGLLNLRQTIYSNAGNTGKKYDTLSEIGITTTKAYNDGGLIELNKDKLREAILADEESVFKVFSNDKAGEPKGVINQMRDSLSAFQENIEKKAGKTTATNSGFSIGRNLINIENRMSTWENKLKMIEDRYWKQFTAMETAINKANQQSSTFFSGQTQ